MSQISGDIKAPGHLPGHRKTLYEAPFARERFKQLRWLFLPISTAIMEKFILRWVWGQPGVNFPELCEEGREEKMKCKQRAHGLRFAWICGLFYVLKRRELEAWGDSGGAWVTLASVRSVLVKAWVWPPPLRPLPDPGDHFRKLDTAHTLRIIKEQWGPSLKNDPVVMRPPC